MKAFFAMPKIRAFRFLLGHSANSLLCADHVNHIDANVFRAF